MRSIIFSLITLCYSGTLSAQADSTQKEKQYGVNLTSSISTSLNLLTSGILATYRINKHQLEFGPKLFMSDRNYYDRLVGTEFNYRYYPNSAHNRFNLFFLANFDYINLYKVSDYEGYIYETGQFVPVNKKTNEHNFILNLGYGFHANLFKGLYIGNNIGAGFALERFKVVRNSVEPTINGTSRYTNFDLSFLFTISLGYRF